jgi:phospholipid/cholesterol/gamma-HCH transport system substrate-binding protein
VKAAIRAHLRDFVAVLGLFALAIAIGGYILSHERLRFPFIQDKPFQVWMEVSNAQGVTPGQGQTVRVAGMRVGDVGKVELKDGLARIRLDLDSEHDDLVRQGATVLSRPRTGLKDMFMALQPGPRSRPAVKEGSTIRVNNTLADVNPDEILRMLDADTRAYLKLLINGAGKGLQGRSRDLREVFRRLGPLHRDLALLNREVVKRRANLARLVHNYGSTVSRLGQEDEDLAAFVLNGSRVFGRLAQEDQRISQAVSRLPSALRRTEATVKTVRELGDVAGPAFKALRRPIRRVDAANSELRPLAKTAEPLLRKDIRPFVRAARPYIKDLRPAARDLAKASPDLRESFFELNRFFNLGAYNPGGNEDLTGDPAKDRARDEGLLHWLGWVSHNSNSLFQTADASGPFRRFILLATCTTYQQILLEQFGTTAPMASEVLGVKDLLLDTGLCPAT